MHSNAGLKPQQCTNAEVANKAGGRGNRFGHLRSY